MTIYGFLWMSISVLVVEDDADIRGDVRDLLEGAGYFVRCASTPEEALRVLAGGPRPCIVLWDAVTKDDGVAMLDRATRDGIHVATLPIAIASVRANGAGKRRPMKALVCKGAILSMIREHCSPQAEASPL